MRELKDRKTTDLRREKKKFKGCLFEEKFRFFRKCLWKWVKF